MVRSEGLETNFANMGLALGSSGPVVRQVPHPNTFLLGYKGVAIGDGVEVDGRAGRVVACLKKGMVRVEFEGGASSDVDASTVEVKTQVAPLELADAFEDAQARAVAPLDPELTEGIDDAETLAEITAALKFEAPSAEAVACLPRVDDVVKVCDGSERFWTLVRAVDGDRVEALVINALGGGQPFAAPGTKIAFERRHMFMIEVFVNVDPADAPTDEQKNACYLGHHEACVKHFKALIDDPDVDTPANWKTLADAGCGTPVESNLAVAAWLRETAATDPSVLAGTGLDADNIGVFRMQPYEKLLAQAQAQAGAPAETPEDDDIASLGIKDLKARIEKGGLTTAGCIDKDDLRARAREADARLAGAARAERFAKCLHNNLMNMVVGPRVVALVFDE